MQSYISHREYQTRDPYFAQTTTEAAILPTGMIANKITFNIC